MPVRIRPTSSRRDREASLATVLSGPSSHRSRTNADTGEARSIIMVAAASDDSGTVNRPLVVSLSSPSSAQFRIPGSSGTTRDSMARSSLLRKLLVSCRMSILVAIAPEASVNLGSSLDSITNRVGSLPE